MAEEKKEDISDDGGSGNEEEKDSLSSEAWIINLLQYDETDGLKPMSEKKTDDRLTSDGRPLYVLDGYDEIVIAKFAHMFHDRDTFLDINIIDERIEAINKFLVLFERKYSKHRPVNQLYDMLFRFKTEIYPSLRLYMRVLDDEFITEPSDVRCMLLNNINQAIDKYSEVLAYRIEHDSKYKRKGLKVHNKWEHLLLSFKITIDDGGDVDDSDGDEEDDYELLGTVPQTEEKEPLPPTILGKIEYKAKEFMNRKRNNKRKKKKKDGENMAKTHQNIIKNAINRKLRKKQAKAEKKRRELLENSSIFKRKFDSYYRYIQTHVAKKVFVMSGVFIIIAPLIQLTWGLYLIYKDFGFDLSYEPDTVDKLLLQYVNGSFYCFLSYLIFFPLFLLIGQRYDLVKYYYVRGDRFHRLRPAVIVFISMYVATKAGRLMLDQNIGYGLNNDIFHFIRFSTIVAIIVFANNVSVVNSIVLRLPKDKNQGLINRIIIPSMSRCINHCFCLKSSYRTDLKGKGLARLLQDTKYEKDLLKALITMPGWKLKKKSVAKVKRQRTRVNRYLRALEDMKVDKAIVMIKRIYAGDLSQATVAEICVGCVHFSIYDRILKFGNYNKRIQAEFDSIQNIYSRWRDLLDDLKAVGDEGMMLQKWLRILHFLEGNKDARTLKERESHGKARIHKHVFKYQKLIEQKHEMLCRLRWVANNGINHDTSDWLLACRCANRICPIPVNWKRKVHSGNGSVSYTREQGRKLRDREAANRYLRDKAFPLPWDTQWTPKNIATAFQMIKNRSAENLKNGLEFASLKFLKIQNLEMKKVLKREKLASIGEASIFEKCIVYETDLKKSMEHEFDTYKKKATNAIVQQAASSVGSG